MAWAAPPAVQWRAPVLAPRGTGTVTPLPGKDIRRARQRRAHHLGGDFDPCCGEVSSRPKNLRRSEPNAALRRVPADYGKPTPQQARRATAAAG